MRLSITIIQELNDPKPECFSFVTDNLVMVASLAATPLHANLSIYDLNMAPGDMGICTFLLPQIRDQSSMWNTEVNISGDQSCLWAPPPSLKVPFFTSHKNKVLGITYTTEEDPYRVSFVFIVPISTILMHVHAIRTGESHRDIIPWEEWGEYGARFLNPGYNPSPTWVRCAYGQEYILSDTYPSMGFEVVRLYDFNPLSLKRALLSTGDSGGATEILTNTTMIETETFAFPVITSLPCQIRTVQLPLHRSSDPASFYGAVMLTEDALIAVSVSRNLWCSRICFAEYQDREMALSFICSPSNLLV